MATRYKIQDLLDDEKLFGEVISKYATALTKVTKYRVSNNFSLKTGGFHKKIDNSCPRCKEEYDRAGVLNIDEVFSYMVTSGLYDAVYNLKIKDAKVLEKLKKIIDSIRALSTSKMDYTRRHSTLTKLIGQMNSLVPVNYQISTPKPKAIQCPVCKGLGFLEIVPDPASYSAVYEELREKALGGTIYVSEAGLFTILRKVIVKTVPIDEVDKFLDPRIIGLSIEYLVSQTRDLLGTEESIVNNKSDKKRLAKLIFNQLFYPIRQSSKAHVHMKEVLKVDVNDDKIYIHVTPDPKDELIHGLTKYTGAPEHYYVQRFNPYNTKPWKNRLTWRVSGLTIDGLIDQALHDFIKVNANKFDNDLKILIKKAIVVFGYDAYKDGEGTYGKKR